jgi:hypothetical protein
METAPQIQSKTTSLMLLLAVAGGILSFVVPTGGGGHSKNADRLLYSFVVIGCNRVDKKDVTPTNASTANLNQLSRTYRDILQLPVRPSLLFFVGDMVMGYTSGDTAALASELRAWVSLYEQSGLKQAGIRLVPVPGNHESLLSKGKPAYAEAEQAWLEVMKPYIAGSNGPGMGGVDSLQTDQSRMTYSFNYDHTHFVLLNTDGVGKVSQVPYRWIIGDVASAHAAGAEHIFLLSHIPAYVFPGEDGLSAYPSQRDTLWSALEANHVEAFMSAHNHVYYRTRPDSGKTWQIISGNGGSPLSQYITSPTQKNYGFTVVDVYKSGRVVLKAYARELPPDNYMGNADGEATTLRDSVELTWGK